MKEARKDFALRVSRRNPPYRFLDFDPVRLLQIPDLQNWNIISL